MSDRAYRTVTFMGWVEDIPARQGRKGQVNEHDILRMILLAEDDEEKRWASFRCEDELHAAKVALEIRGYGFGVKAVARADRVFVRSL